MEKPKCLTKLDDISLHDLKAFMQFMYIDKWNEDSDYPQLMELYNEIISTTENKIDGLIFTSIYDPIKFGRDYNLLKWKEFHTIDFLVKKVSKKINLYYTKKGTNVIYRSFSIKEASHIISFVKESDLMDGIIIEFKVNCETDCFTPYRLRGDKNKPNGEITVNNTIINIKENIKIEDLIV